MAGVTIHLHHADVRAKGMERHGYEVKEMFGELEYADEMKDRYDSFMNYLNM